jgi:hypothetical protein
LLGFLRVPVMSRLVKNAQRGGMNGFTLQDNGDQRCRVTVINEAIDIRG